MRILTLMFALSLVLGFNIAWAHEDDAPAVAPDPLAGLSGMLGKWEGSGTSAFGPFTCNWEATRAGIWLVAVTHIFDEQGNNVENATQVFGANADGSLLCYTFDTSGLAEKRVSAAIT